MRIADNFDRVLNIVVAQSIGIGPPFKLPLDVQPTLMRFCPLYRFF
jgi:hypothetical protein